MSDRRVFVLPSMWLLKIQFFVSYAVMGSMMPLLTVYLGHEKGFSKSNIGVVMAASGFSMIISPVLMTLLADMRIESRRIIAAALAISTFFILGMHFANGVWLVGACYVIYHLSYVSIPPLQDGMYFRMEAEHDPGAGPLVPYGSVRVWGTAGFIVPSLMLWAAAALLPGGKEAITGSMMYCAAAFAVVSAFHSLRLPPNPPRGQNASRLPSVAAAQVIFGPEGRWMCLPLIITYLCAPAYHAFFPLYLKEVTGYSESVIGLIICIGVLIEIFVIFNLERLRKRFGLKRLMVFGVICMAFRFACLAAFQNAWTPILVQLFHGPEIAALFVLPIMYINRLAGAEFRNSIQGVYAMLVLGSPRIVGSYLSGQVAKVSLPLLFTIAAVLVTIAAAVLALKFEPVRAEDLADEKERED
ncbi:MAG: MFS transporter [Verrucomicrobia bacterium]|nr:MFS transporter [Verrucomicrobiota bacterium]